MPAGTEGLAATSIVPNAEAIGMAVVHSIGEVHPVQPDVVTEAVTPTDSPVEVFDSVGFLTRNELTHLGDLKVDAHGGVYTVEAALRECGPFAKMFTALAESLKHVPDKSRILEQSVRAMETTSKPVIEATSCEVDSKKK